MQPYTMHWPMNLSGNVIAPIEPVYQQVVQSYRYATEISHSDADVNVMVAGGDQLGAYYGGTAYTGFNYSWKTDSDNTAPYIHINTLEAHLFLGGAIIEELQPYMRHQSISVNLDLVTDIGTSKVKPLATLLHETAHLRQFSLGVLHLPTVVNPLERVKLSRLMESDARAHEVQFAWDVTHNPDLAARFGVADMAAAWEEYQEACGLTARVFEQAVTCDPQAAEDGRAQAATFKAWCEDSYTNVFYEHDFCSTKHLNSIKENIERNGSSVRKNWASNYNFRLFIDRLTHHSSPYLKHVDAQEWLRSERFNRLTSFSRANIAEFAMAEIGEIPDEWKDSEWKRSKNYEIGNTGQITIEGKKISCGFLKEIFCYDDTKPYLFCEIIHGNPKLNIQDSFKPLSPEKFDELIHLIQKWDIRLYDRRTRLSGDRLIEMLKHDYAEFQATQLSAQIAKTPRRRLHRDGNQQLHILPETAPESQTPLPFRVKMKPKSLKIS